MYYKIGIVCTGEGNTIYFMKGKRERNNDKEGVREWRIYTE